MTKLNRAILGLGVGALALAGCGREEPAPPTAAGSPAPETVATFRKAETFHWETDWRKRPIQRANSACCAAGMVVRISMSGSTPARYASNSAMARSCAVRRA